MHDSVGLVAFMLGALIGGIGIGWRVSEDRVCADIFGDRAVVVYGTCHMRGDDGSVTPAKSLVMTVRGE